MNTTKTQLSNRKTVYSAVWRFWVAVAVFFGIGDFLLIENTKTTVAVASVILIVAFAITIVAALLTIVLFGLWYRGRYAQKVVPAR